ncbi:hypothetical protein F5Y14DRAFT_235723 [Nemania sp. NC0429]|nr:hypothetical protein F5Y14DRAFT_235723 [Nemania sp. NC0429]
MAEAIYEFFKYYFDKELEGHLDLIADTYPFFAPLRAKIKGGGYTFVRRGKPSKLGKSPDGSIYYDGGLAPSFVYEIAYSQTERELDEAVEYLDWWPKSISAALSFNFDYNKRKEPNFAYIASVSLWTATITKDDTQI